MRDPEVRPANVVVDSVLLASKLQSYGAVTPAANDKLGFGFDPLGLSITVDGVAVDVTIEWVVSDNGAIHELVVLYILRGAECIYFIVDRVDHPGDEPTWVARQSCLVGDGDTKLVVAGFGLVSSWRPPQP